MTVSEQDCGLVHSTATLDVLDTISITQSIILELVQVSLMSHKVGKWVCGIKALCIKGSNPLVKSPRDLFVTCKWLDRSRQPLFQAAVVLLSLPVKFQETLS